MQRQRDYLQETNCFIMISPLQYVSDDRKQGQRIYQQIDIGTVTTSLISGVKFMVDKPKKKNRGGGAFTHGGVWSSQRSNTNTKINPLNQTHRPCRDGDLCSEIHTLHVFVPQRIPLGFIFR